MKIDEHATNLGGLILTFHSLELTLRGFLTKLPGARPLGLELGVDFYSCPVGTKLPVSDLTDYRSLGALISQYNSEISSRGRKWTIDASLVHLRDAIAHGRVCTREKHTPLCIIKYSRPEDGFVEVEFNAVMTKEWFKKHQNRVSEALFLVHKAIAELETETTVPKERIT